MKWPCTSKMNSSLAVPTCTRASGSSKAASFGRSKKPPERPAAAFAALKASSVLAAPQEESRNLRRGGFVFFEKEEAKSCARPFPARVAGGKGARGRSAVGVAARLDRRRLA